jgi:DNA-binding transcriptional ArsR family regulator
VEKLFQKCGKQSIILLVYFELVVIQMEYKFSSSRNSLVNSGDELDNLFAGDEDIERASRSLKAMSHPLRLKILCTLGDQEVSVQEIVEAVGTSQSNISQHLAILRDKGILASRKDANRVFYRVSDNRTLQLIGMMRNVFCQHKQ